MARNETLFRRYCRRGDVRALGKLFDRTADETLRVAMYFASDPAQAEEWLQETYLIAIEKAEGWDQTRPFLPWLLGILRNVVRRSHGARTFASLPDAPLPAPATADAAQALEWTAAVSEAAQRLRNPYRAVLILRLQHGLEPAEIAQLQRVPAATIRSQIHRGLMQLKRDMPQDRRPQALASLAMPVGLAAVRGRVLSAAEAGTPVAATGLAWAGYTALGGFLVQKLILVALAAAAVLLVAVDPLDLLRREEATGPSIEQKGLAARGQKAEPNPKETDGPALQGSGTATDTRAGAAKARVGPDVDLDQVDRELDLHGTVVLRDGRPVVGAAVRLETTPWEALMTNGLNREWTELASTTTGPRGTFALRLAEGAHGRVRVEAPGYAPRCLLAVAAGERVRVVLDQAVVLVVRVMSPDGLPAPAVPIRVWGTTALERVSTDVQGVVRLEGLDPKALVTLWALPQVEGWGLSSMERVTLPSEGVQEHLIELPVGRTIRGTVTDAATDAPLPHTGVGMGWFMEPTVQTDEKGAYVLHGWTGRGVREITARQTGYDRATIRVEDGAEIVDLALNSGAIVRGRIVDESSTPLPEALVSIIASVRENGEQRMSVSSGRTDTEGRFALGGLARDLPHSINVRAAGMGRRMVDIDAIEGSEQDVGDLVLGAPLRLSGRVVRSDGSPAAHLEVTIKGVNADRAKRRASGQPAHTSHYGTYERVTTDDLGRFLVVDLCPATYTVTCKPEGSPPAEVRSVRLRHGVDHPHILLRLPGTRRLRIRIFDPDGGPATGAEIGARYENKNFRALLDSRGQAVLEIPDAVTSLRLQVHGKNDSTLR